MASTGSLSGSAVLRRHTPSARSPAAPWMSSMSSTGVHHGYAPVAPVPGAEEAGAAGGAQGCTRPRGREHVHCGYTQGSEVCPAVSTCSCLPRSCSCASGTSNRGACYRPALFGLHQLSCVLCHCVLSSLELADPSGARAEILSGPWLAAQTALRPPARCLPAPHGCPHAHPQRSPSRHAAPHASPSCHLGPSPLHRRPLTSIAAVPL